MFPITLALVAFSLGFILATNSSLKAIEWRLREINSTLNSQIDISISEKKKTLAERAIEKGETNQ